MLAARFLRVSHGRERARLTVRLGAGTVGAASGLRGQRRSLMRFLRPTPHWNGGRNATFSALVQLVPQSLKCDLRASSIPPPWSVHKSRPVADDINNEEDARAIRLTRAVPKSLDLWAPREGLETARGRVTRPIDRGLCLPQIFVAGCRLTERIVEP